MAVGTLTEVVGTRFMNYLQPFKPYLLDGLQNKAEHQVRLFLLNYFVSLQDIFDY